MHVLFLHMNKTIEFPIRLELHIALSKTSFQTSYASEITIFNLVNNIKQ